MAGVLTQNPECFLLMRAIARAHPQQQATAVQMLLQVVCVANAPT